MQEEEEDYMHQLVVVGGFHLCRPYRSVCLLSRRDLHSHLHTRAHTHLLSRCGGWGWRLGGAVAGEREENREQKVVVVAAAAAEKGEKHH